MPAVRRRPAWRSGNRRSRYWHGDKLAATVKVGYSLAPGWTSQWRSIQRHLARLREQYQGVEMLGNVDVEETVHALFLALNHLYDWLHQDSALSLDEATVRAFVDNHPDSLGLCRAYANTRKHMGRTQPGALIAQIASIESGTRGQAATIGYRSLGSVRGSRYRG